MNREERVLRVINGQDVDYLPSQINIADRSRYTEISNALGLDSADDLDGYLENHLFLTMTLQDKPLLFRDIKDEMDRIHEKGFCNPDWSNDIVYDNWGLGIQVGTGTFNVVFHPLQGKASKEIIDYMPPQISEEAVFAGDIETAIRKYKIPDINMEDNLSDWESDLQKYSGDFLVWPSGYYGIYERSYAIVGWEEFMANMALKPNAIEELLDKVTDYKVEFAQRLVETGFKVAHHGDDFGAQNTSLFSRPMFKKMIIPRLKREWEVFTDANVPIMLHSCGNITEFLPDLIDIGLRILEPVQPCMDLGYLKKEFGKDLIFFGGIDTQKLPYITPEETKRMARDAIRILGKDGGMIIAPSQEIMNDVPVENIKALVETIREERVNVLV